MFLSSFRAVPRKGHLEREKRIVGYLSKMKHGVIIFHTALPDYSDILEKIYDWEKSVYGSTNEAKPHDAPIALGKHIILTHYVDANLYHEMITGRSVTYFLHFINQTLVEWFYKKQATCETATY